MLNRIEIIGRLGADPESRKTDSGTSVTTMSVATHRKYTTSGGTDREETTWHSVTAFGRLAETCAQYLEKGSLVYLSGRLSKSQYTDNEGVERRSTEIVARTVKFLPSGSQSSSPSGSKPDAADDDFEKSFDDDDIPF